MTTVTADYKIKTFRDAVREDQCFARQSRPAPPKRSRSEMESADRRSPAPRSNRKLRAALDCRSPIPSRKSSWGPETQRLANLQS